MSLMKLGVAAILYKPIAKEELVQAVQKVLGS